MAPPGEKWANYADRCAPGQRARGCMVTRGRSGARFLTTMWPRAVYRFVCGVVVSSS